MPCSFRVLAAALLVAIVVPSAAFAQEPALAPQGGAQLYWPTIAAGTAATADWITTYHALKFYKVQETNPLLKPLQTNPAPMVSLGGIIHLARVSAWNFPVGPHNGQISADGLLTLTPV